MLQVLAWVVWTEFLEQVLWVVLREFDLFDFFHRYFNFLFGFFLAYGRRQFFYRLFLLRYFYIQRDVWHDGFWCRCVFYLKVDRSNCLLLDGVVVFQFNSYRFLLFGFALKETRYPGTYLLAMLHKMLVCHNQEDDEHGEQDQSQTQCLQVGDGVGGYLFAKGAAPAEERVHREQLLHKTQCDRTPYYAKEGAEEPFPSFQRKDKEYAQCV